MRRTSGFTIIELVSALALVCVVIVLVILQKNNLDASSRDQERKTALNAVYYGLKEGYYVKNKSFPSEINSKNLPYVDPKSFVQVGDDASKKLHYKALNCSGDKCQDFELSVRLEKEATYKKTSD